MKFWKRTLFVLLLLTLLPVTAQAEEEEVALPQLDAPYDLVWNMEVPDGEWGSETCPYVPHTGNAAWSCPEVTDGLYEVYLYREGIEEPLHKGGVNTHPDHPWNSMDLVNYITESGTYYFTVQSISQSTTYASSEVVTSASWVYEKPTEALDPCKNLRMEGSIFCWDHPDNATPGKTLYRLKIYFHYENGTRKEVESYLRAWDTHYELQPDSWTFLHYGQGTYTYEVWPTSHDISLLLDGPTASLTTYIDGYSGACGKNLRWQFNPETTTLTVTGTGEMDGNTYAWRYLNPQITRAVINEGLTHLRGRAFENAINLTEVSFPDSLVRIEYNAFANCTSLKRLVFPKNLSGIGPEVFLGSGIQELYFTGKRFVFREDSFAGLTATVYYPAGDSSWKLEMQKNYGGTIVWKPYTELHSHAYTETVTDPTCTEQGYTTYACACGESYVDNYIAAAGHSFGDWYVVREATTEAEGEERRDCGNCVIFETRVTEKLPEESLPIGGQCGDNLTWSFDPPTGTLTISGIGDMWNFIVNILQRSTDPAVPWAAYQSEIKRVILPEELTRIGSNAFNGCGNLTEVVIPKTVTEVGTGAFLNCAGLEEITFAGDVPAQIGENAFQGVTATVIYPEDNETWTEDKLQDYGGSITWEPGKVHAFKPGDVNHDGKINAKDATLILQSSVGVLKTTASFCEECAEVSGDGKLNAKDSTLILQFSVGLRDNFPAEK